MKYLIKAITQSTFLPTISGVKNKFLGGETLTFCAKLDTFNNPVIDFKDEDERIAYEDAMGKPRGFLKPNSAYWSDKSEVSPITGEITGPFVYKHTVNRDPKTGDDIGVEVETGLDNDEKIEKSLIIKMLKNAPGVSWNNERIYGAGLSITSVEEMATKKVENRKARNTAGAKLEELTPKEQRKYYSLIFNRETSDLTDEVVYDKLTDYIEGGKSKAETFIALLEDKSSDEKFKYTLLYNKNIITKDNSGFHYQGIRLGFTLDEVYSTLKDKKNQELKHRIDQEFIKVNG